jgi:hypothetical protein
MAKGKISLLQARMLTRFYKREAYDHGVGSSVGYGNGEFFSPSLDPETVLGDLKIRNEEEDRAIKQLYDLVSKKYLKQYKESGQDSLRFVDRYFMTRKGLRDLRKLNKRGFNSLEKYTKPEIKTEASEGNKLERITQGIAASILIIFGFFLIISNSFITGAVTLNPSVKSPLIIGFIMIITGTILLITKNKDLIFFICKDK